MAVITDLIAKLKLDDTQFKAGLSSAQGHVQSFSENAISSLKKVVSALAIGYVVHELVSELKEATQRVEDLVHTSQKLGIGVGPLQELDFAAKLAGTSTEGLNTTLKFMEKNIANAALGMGQAGKYLDLLGLSAKDLAAMAPEEQFLAISDALKQVHNSSEQTAIAIGLMGKGAQQSLGLMKSDVRATIEEYKKLGIELNSNQAAAMETFGEKVKTLDTVWEGFKNQLASALAGPLTGLITSLLKNIESMGGLASIARSTATAIKTAFSEIAEVIHIAMIPLEGFNDAIKAAGLASAKMAEARAKSKLADANDFGSKDEIKKAASDYANAQRYTEGMRSATNGTYDAQVKINDAAKEAADRQKDIADATAEHGRLLALDGVKNDEINTTVKDRLKAEKDLNKEKKDGIETQIKGVKAAFESQKLSTSEIQRQIEASHALYDATKATKEFDKQAAKDRDGIAASVRQDKQEDAAGLRNAQGTQWHQGDRDKDLDKYQPATDKVGHVVIDQDDSERTKALKDEYNQKVDDRIEQIKHTNLLTELHKVEVQHSVDEKNALAQLDKQLEAIKNLIAGKKDPEQPPDTAPQAPSNQYNTTDKLAPWSMDINRDGKTAHYGNEKQAQTVNVNVQAADGFLATVANSPQVKASVTSVTNSAMNNAARGQ